MNGMVWDAAWKSTLFLATVLIACRALRHRSASLRQLLLSAAVVAMLAGAIIMAAAPRWLIEIPAQRSVREPASAPIWTGLPAAEPVAPLPVAIKTSSEPNAPVFPWRMVVPAIWGLGAGVVLIRLAVVMLRLRRIRAQGIRIRGIARGVDVFESEGVTVPMSWGVFRHAIAVPVGFGDLPETQRSAVLDHEREHIRRKDSLMRVLAETACAILWFQPLMWVVRWRLREEQERACDDAVLAKGTKPSAYAGALLEWQDRASPGNGLVAVGISEGSCLKQRLRAILDPRIRRERVGARRAVLLWAVALVVALSLGSLKFVRAQEPAREPALPAGSRILIAQTETPAAAPARMAPTAGWIAGRVVEDHSGEPVRAAGVRIAAAGGTVIADVETDGQGSFRSPELQPGVYQLEISKPNYSGATVRLAVNGAAPALLARMVRHSVITGRVTDSQAKPVPGATLVAFPEPEGGASRSDINKGSEWQAVTNADGQYRLFGLPPGRYIVAMLYGNSAYGLESIRTPTTPQAFGAGYQFYPSTRSPEARVVSGGDEIRGVDFTIGPPAAPAQRHRIQGKALSEPGYVFRFTVTGVDPPRPIGFMSSPQNTFEFGSLAPGSYTIFVAGAQNNKTSGLGAAANEGLYARMNVVVGDRDVDGIVITPSKPLTAKLELSGGGGVCPSKADVSLTPVERGSPLVSRRITVEAGKQAEVAGLAPAPYKITAEGLGAECVAEPAMLDLSGGESGLFEIPLTPLSVVRGRLQANRGSPADFVAVLVGGPAVQVAYVGARWNFEFSGVRPGKYRIAARPRADDAASRWLNGMEKMMELEVPGGKPVDLVLTADSAESAK